MSKFGGGSSSSNDKLINQQKNAEQQQKRDNFDREERLRAGRDRIRAMFSEGGGSWQGARRYQRRKASGGPKMISKPATNSFSLGGNKVSGMPNFSAFLTTPSSKPVQVKNPNYRPAGWGTVRGKGGREAGIGQDFYDNFKSSILDFHQPEVDRQWGEAKSQNLFDLARRGLLKSSRATDAAGDLTRVKAESDAKVKSDAEAQASALRSDVANARRNALNLLSTTEDPSAAASAAQQEVNAIQTRAPQFSDLGNLFASVLTAAGQSQQAANARSGINGIPTRSPYQSSGRGY